MKIISTHEEDSTDFVKVESSEQDNKPTTLPPVRGRQNKIFYFFNYRVIG